jgi:uncharacterized membrane protein YdcZ (DUF606 family)
MKPWEFIVSFLAAYIIPAICLPPWTGWVGIILVYIIDMWISRRKWPEEMNTPKITLSEWMTYVGGLIAVIFLFISLSPEVDGKILFPTYIIICSAGYIIWATSGDNS